MLSWESLFLLGWLKSFKLFYHFLYGFSTGWRLTIAILLLDKGKKERSQKGLFSRLDLKFLQINSHCYKGEFSHQSWCLCFLQPTMLKPSNTTRFLGLSAPCLYSQVWNKFLWALYRLENIFYFTKKMKPLFLWGVTCKLWGITVQVNSGKIPNRHMKIFHNYNKSVIGKISSGNRRILQHWTHLSFTWTGCLATLSRLCFWQEKLDEMLIEFPSKLVFCDSVILWFSYSGRS